MTPTRTVFMGMRCEFSRVPFQAVLAAGCSVVGLIIPSRGPAGPRLLEPPQVPMIPTDIVSLAQHHDLPVWEIGPLQSEAALAALDGLRPDLICVACFPRLLPPAWLRRPPRGCLNLHPSLLPAYRGPEPLFWQFRNGEAHTGVSLHVIDRGADTGDLVAQAAVPFPDGIGGVEAERMTAQAGAQLLVEALQRDDFPRASQPQAGASCFPRPTAADLVIPTDWPARRAFNFIRGAGAWGLTIEVAGQRLAVEAALGYAPEARSARAVERRDDEWWVQFTPGVLRALGQLA